MITVKEALSIIYRHTSTFSLKPVKLEEALGKILMEDLFADRDFPPFDRVTMDGIAIDYSSYATGQRDFPVMGIGPAGAPQITNPNQESCVEIMTGAMLPMQADTVIRYEDVEIKDGIATILVNNLNQGKNVHRQGEDRKKGTLILPKYTKISPAEIGVAATLGKTTLLVTEIPKAAIITTGDELVAVNETPQPYQIRKSNAYQIQAALLDWGVQSDLIHVSDDKEATYTKLSTIIDEYGIVLMTGGVSKGKFDYVPGALERLQVKKLFHGVAQRPGKPFWFGLAENGTKIFAFPGNPVSTFMCTNRFFYAWLNKSLGLGTVNYPHAQLAEDYTFKPHLTYYLQVKISFSKEGCVLATPVTGNGSGDLANLILADAFLELPEDRESFYKGESFPYIMFR